MANEFLFNYLKDFIGENNKKTKIENIFINNQEIPIFINSFWTSKQRQSSSLHEISYRACFKAELPEFFIKLLTKEGDIVYDPFGGRGTTAIEAGINNRNVISNDISPLSNILAKSRFFIPSIKDIKQRLLQIPLKNNIKSNIDLSMFFQKQTESEIVSLKNYLKEKKENNQEDYIDSWIRMIATNRLTGHSKGYFSIYTLPPNQAVSQNSQIKINKKRNQIPEYKNINERIIKKTKNLLRKVNDNQIKLLNKIGKNALFLNKDSRSTKEIEVESVQLTVTSPPFLNIVQYSKDNWLRCWFNSIDDKEIEEKITMSKTINEWCDVMSDVFKELFRITKPKGWVAFEVGEIRNKTINLDEHVVPLGINVGFRCKGIVINNQKFTKTSSIWGIKNNKKGTNTNRIVLFQKN